jgi:hypothetical protein
MFKKITQKIKNRIFRDTENLKFTHRKIGWIFTRLHYVAKNDFSYSLYDYLNGYESEVKKFKEGKIFVVFVLTWTLPFVTEKRIINNYLSIVKR